MEHFDRKKNISPFPQANDFDKIMKILSVENEEYLKDNDYLMRLLELSSRQVNYYLAACEFLGFVKMRKFSIEGKFLRTLNIDLQVSKACASIISKPVFGVVFFSKFLYNEELNTDEIAELIGLIYDLESESVTKRRASTVKNWVNWIYNKTEK